MRISPLPQQPSAALQTYRSPTSTSRRQKVCAWYATACTPWPSAFAQDPPAAADSQPGHKILVYGASGAIGTAMVQLAKSSGAAVTAVVATRHLELVKSLGADRAVDYTSEDFTRIGETFNFVVDVVGKTSFFRCRKLLKPDGVFATTDLGPWGQNLVLAMWSSITRSKRVVIPTPGRINGFVGFMKSRMEAGQFRAIIDRKYDLAAIANAYRYVETGQKVGIVVINVAAADESAHVA